MPNLSRAVAAPALSPSAAEAERLEFETWWRENMNTVEWDLHRNIYPMNRGWCYTCHETDRGWMCWIARAELERFK